MASASLSDALLGGVGWKEDPSRGAMGHSLDGVGLFLSIHGRFGRRQRSNARSGLHEIRLLRIELVQRSVRLVDRGKSGRRRRVQAERMIRRRRCRGRHRFSPYEQSSGLKIDSKLSDDVVVVVVVVEMVRPSLVDVVVWELNNKRKSIRAFS